MKTSWLGFLVFLACCSVSAKPALNEENRNLCESETDKAECLREVEEAKGGISPAAEQPQDDYTQEQERSASNENTGTEEDPYARIERVYKNSEANRKFWKEELRSMNKWEKYGLS